MCTKYAIIYIVLDTKLISIKIPNNLISTLYLLETNYVKRLVKRSNC